MGDRQAVVSREMTKLHEEFIRGFLSEILSCLKQRPKIKGECTLLVKGYEAGNDISPENLDAELLRALENRKTALPDLVKKISKKYSLPKSEVYKQAVKINNAATKDTDNGTT
jgi:16S rRNA (cytidine1402-2'-O)-methyltransferase